MKQETFLYIFGVALLPASGALIYLVMAMRDLVFMHRNPEKTGFGTVGLKPLLARNTRALEEMIHYLKWVAKESIGKSPPPPPPTLDLRAMEEEEEERRT